MGLIDADALKKYMDDCGWCDNCPDKKRLCEMDCRFPDFCTHEWQRVIDEQPTIPASPWHRVEEELPESNDAVNVVWVNRNPESYYADIKDKPFVATAHYHNGKWYWFSATCKDYLDEYGRCEVDEVDKDIDILYWMPLPSPPVNKMFTK